MPSKLVGWALPTYFLCFEPPRRKERGDILMIDLIIKSAQLPQEFSAIQSVRQAVFQAEQGVEPELDFDGKDETSEQIIAYIDGKPVGTARIRYLNDKIAKIERLAVLPLSLIHI